MNFKSTYKAIALAAVLLSSPLLAIAQKGISVGSYVFKDGAVYTGDLYNGKPNGIGTTKFPNGDISDGNDFKDNRPGAPLSNTSNG